MPQWYTYDASFFTTWLVTTWTVLFLPLYAVCCLVSGRFGVRKLGSELRDSIFAFRDKGFTIGIDQLKRKHREQMAMSARLVKRREFCRTMLPVLPAVGRH